VTEPIWVARPLVAMIHSAQIQEHGGSLGVRDEAMIESALSRPQNKWQYEPEADLFTLAAACGYGLTKNHGFIDGNKRVGYMTTYVFLGLNGFDIDAAEPEVVLTMLDLASGSLSEEHFADWLRTHAVAVPE
jgi:death-on-curing protein